MSEASTGPRPVGYGGPALVTVTGTVLFPERIARPPRAVLTVTVEDVSRADGST